MNAARSLHRLRPGARGTLAAGACLVLLAGCASTDDRIIALENENLELRAENRDLDESLRETQTQRALLEGEVRALNAENDRMRLQASSVQSAPSGPTGFEGITGVTASSVSGGVLLNVEGDVLFASGSVTLKKSAKATLDRVADVLKGQYGGNTIRIAGHTDTDKIKKSKWKTNERLSAERALAVEEYLATKGLDKDAMYVAAFGPAEPKGSKAASRRVEIFVLGG